MLTTKQTTFVAEYVRNGLNASKAALSAGYSARSAPSQGQRMLKHVEIAAAIAQKTRKHVEKSVRDVELIDISAERTLQELGRLAFFDPINLFEADGSVKRIQDIDANTRSVIAGFEVSEIFDGETGEQKHAIGLLKKIKVTDRKGALDMLMRYHDLYKDKADLNVNIGIQLVHAVPRPERVIDGKRS